MGRRYLPLFRSRVFDAQEGLCALRPTAIDRGSIELRRKWRARRRVHVHTAINVTVCLTSRGDSDDVTVLVKHRPAGITRQGADVLAISGTVDHALEHDRLAVARR